MKQAMAKLRWRLGERRTRRVRPSYKGNINLRRMVRDNLRHGGEPVHLAFRRRVYRPRSLVILCDISGSMERYSRMLLHFIHALTHGLMDTTVEAFVFGTRHPDPAHIAADLYHRGVVRYVVLTGGHNATDGRCEALSHLRILLAEGVPRARAIVEQASSNTKENVTGALRALAEADCGAIRSVVAVVKWYHSRRALMTLRRYFPAGTRYYAVTYAPPGIPRVGWERDAVAAQRVRQEWEAIPRYLAAGDIAEVRRDGDAYV